MPVAESGIEALHVIIVPTAAGEASDGVSVTAIAAEDTAIIANPTVPI
jgi:hypothetical protein